MRGVIGIDPGKSGGICFQSLERKIVAPFESYEDRINGRWLRAWIFEVLASGHQIEECWIEDVHAMQTGGNSTNFNYGRYLGNVEGVLDSMGLTIKRVTPQRWQKFYGFEKVPMGSTTAVKKERNVAAFKKTWPGWNITLKGARVMHMGMVDACLIANYGFRQMTDRFLELEKGRHNVPA